MQLQAKDGFSWCLIGQSVFMKNKGIESDKKRNPCYKEACVYNGKAPTWPRKYLFFNKVIQLFCTHL